MSTRDYSRWNLPVISYPSVMGFLLTTRFISGIHAIELPGGRILDIMVHDRISTQAVIFFNAAVNREKTALPFFSGVGVSQGLPATFIAVSDSSLDDDDKLSLGWYSGSLKAPLQKILPGVLAHLLESLGCRRSILFGSSGGGFAAMLYARTLPNALPIAVNPQTRISKYSTAFVQAFARASWDWDGEHNLAAFIHGRMVERLGTQYRMGNSPFLYIQNNSDWHVAEHAVPFSSEIGGLRTATSGMANTGRMIYRDWGNGHEPLPREETSRLLMRASLHAGDWESLVRDFGEF